MHGHLCGVVCPGLCQQHRDLAGQFGVLWCNEVGIEFKLLLAAHATT